MEDNIEEEHHDIEELAKRSQRMKVCGYFAARSVSIHKADVIVTVYQSVLSEATREALGLDLEGRILVFDEAHNLMDSITQINSVDLCFLKVILAQ